jgi:hypothetical protein
MNFPHSSCFYTFCPHFNFYAFLFCFHFSIFLLMFCVLSLEAIIIAAYLRPGWTVSLRLWRRSNNNSNGFDHDDSGDVSSLVAGRLMSVVERNVKRLWSFLIWIGKWKDFKFSSPDADDWQHRTGTEIWTAVKEKQTFMFRYSFIVKGKDFTRRKIAFRNWRYGSF